MGRLGVAALVALAAGLALTPSGSAATVDGRIRSADEPLGPLQVSLLRAKPGAERPARLAHALSDRRGRFTLKYAGGGTSAAGAVYYLTAREAGAQPAQEPAQAPEPPPSTGCRGATKPGIDSSIRCRRAGKKSRRPGPVRLATIAGERVPREVTLNERTTVAAGYGMAQFISQGRIAGDAPGLPNAAAMLANLASSRSGAIAATLQDAPNGSETETLPTFNTLANLLAPCVRDERRCDRLLALAKPPGGREPSGLLQAVADIARNPANDVEALAQLAGSGPRVYSPALGADATPDAWTLALRFDGDGKTLDGPGNFAIDADGNVWVVNNYDYQASPQTPACGSDELIEFTPDGRFAPGSPYTGGGLSGAGFGIGFDPDGDLWAGNYGFAGVGCDVQPAHNSVSKFDPSGLALSPPEGFTQGSISWPQGTESDRDGNIWIANCGNGSVTMLPGGDPTAARNISGIGLSEPFDVALTADGRAFVTGIGSDSVAMLNPDGTPTAVSPILSGGLNRPMGITVDSRGNMWVANSGLISLPCPEAQPSFETRGGSLTLIRPNGEPAQETAFTGGGLTIPWGNTVDGDDNVWVANFGKKRVSQFCGTRPSTCPPGTQTGEPISPDGTGYGFDGLVRNTGLAVDPSGNLWVANNWLTVPAQTNPGGHQVVVFVGIAAPQRTPLIGPPRR